MILPTLYAKNKDGSLQEWAVVTNGADIITTFGKVEGKIQKAVKTAKPKNIGQKNETTPEQQAELEAQSMWQKQIDSGYFQSAKEARETIVFLPMLAHELKKKDKLKFPVYMQPKMDGVRCLARWNGDKIQLLSRGGKEYSVPHISKALESMLVPGTVFDGELYIHGVLRQDIQALVKKHRSEPYAETGKTSLDIQYWVYDCFDIDSLDKPFAIRTAELQEALQKTDGTIRRVITHTILNLPALENLHKSFNRNGFEGSIIRLPEGTYELGNRSRSLLKYKDFQDAEFEVIGFTMGVGKFSGCVIWKCKTNDGKIFDVVPKGTLEQKKQWFLDGLDCIGEKLTVKFQSLSKDGIPEFPVGIAFRLKED